MAKKITIEGSNLLDDLSDDWGGVNETESAVTVYGTPVPAGAEWGVNRGEVERFVKEQFASKVGDVYWEADGAFYNILGFATTADRTLYISDPETHANLVLFRRQLPISTVSSDSYVCRLTGDISTASNYVIKNGRLFPVNLRYQSIFIEGATSTSTNFNADGTIIIERSVNAGSSWTQVARLSGITSADPTATTFPIAVNLNQYMVASMNNRFRIRASFQYIEDGVTKTKYSPYVTYVVSSVNLAVEMATDWSAPITANASTTQMSLNFTLYGAVQKYLTIKVDGTTFINGSPYDSSYNAEQTGGITITDSTKNIFTHGVHEVEVFLTCSDGAGGTLTSDVMKYSLMVYNASTPGADLTQPFLLLQEVADSVDNFVQSRICGYAIYHPSGSDIELTLIVCSSAQDYVTNPSTAYLFEQRTASCGVQYDLTATLEIEDQSGSTLNAFLQVLRDNNGSLVNFLYETTGAAYQVIPVDNTAGYGPTAGKTFYLNPKLRNNDEANPERILNAANGNAEITSVWQNFKLGNQDGWLVDSEGNRMLFIPAGCLLNIALNPFAQFLTQPNSSMTMEFDIKVSNVTNEDDPILRICEASGTNFIGLRLRPMTGTMTTASHTTEDTSNFSWQEDERVHISININNAVAPNSAGDGLTSDGSTPTGTLALVRVLVNGVINREFVYSTTSASEFCTGALSNGGIYIGQEGADIAIYGIGVWSSQQLSSRNVVQNVIATIPSATEKEEMKRANDIMESGVIDVEKVKALGKNVLIWHGAEVWHGASSKQNGWWEFAQYDADGQYLPELSGTICKATATLPSSGQGTTAKTYYYWNLQTKFTDITGTINVPLTDLHESITYEVDSENGVVALKGGNLGSGFPLSTETAKNYPLVDVDGAPGVTVPDGWIDGNGKYRGMGYTIANGVPMAQKLVLKINYASSMQSHIIGVNKLYNDLHKAYCGPNALQAATPGAMVAKHLEPFLFFTQASDNASPVYRGPGAWGPGKMDKPTWGYVKNAFPNFTMIEGADNNKELTDMRVPFDDTVHTGDTYPKVYYHPENEAWMYRVDGGLQNSQKCIDFDGGKTVDIGSDSLDGTHLYAGEYPHPNIVAFIRNAWNFLFLHNPRIKPYITSGGTLGSFSDFTNSAAAQDTGNKYWCSDYKLYRYDFADGAWVAAGLWNGNSYDEVLLKDSTAESGTIAYETYTAWNALTNNQKADYEGAVNTAFITGIVAHCKANIGNYFVINSLKFHYAFQNHFIAGTDNCSKNTYYVLVPTAGTMGNWSGWKFELHQDDVDTVLATDNSGLQTKPYYIDRMHPYAEDDVLETDSLYEGTNNVLFNLCEEMWENTLEIGDTLRSVLSSMSALTGGMGSSASDQMNGVWKALNRYLFDVQRYIPAMAYNEAARIRYEFPKLMNYTSDQRQVDPIEQSMGDQLQAELQWMKRRLVYMASYAAFGEFAPGSTVNTGLSDLSQSFAMVMAALPNSTTQTSTYTFKLVPHQWLYPTAAIAQSGLNPHVRVAPNAANMPNGYYEISISPTSRSDDGITIYAINYYRSIGNIGDNCFNPSGALTLNGKRLTQFVAEPSTYYSTTVGGGSITAEAWQQLSDADKANYQPAFRCSGIFIGSATRIATLSFNGCSRVGGATIDISSLIRAATIDMRHTNVLSIAFPETPTLTTVHLPASLTSLSLVNQPSLATLDFEGVGSLTSMEITNSPLLGSASRAYVLSMIDADAAVTLLRLYNISWQTQPVDADVVRWLIAVGDDGVCDITGGMSVVSGALGRLYYADVKPLIERYGDIRDTENSLYIDFAGTSIVESVMSIDGKKYINTDSSSANYDLDVNQNFDGLDLLVTTGNDVAVAYKSDGSPTPDVVWELTDSGASTYAEFQDPYSPVLHLKQTGAAVRNVVLHVQATLTNTSGEERVVTKTIGLWNRIPEVGDYAWTDGQFDNTNDASKKLAGMVIRRQEVSSGVYELDILSAADTSFPTSQVAGGNESTWGPYPAASNGFSDAKTDGAYDDPVIEAVRQAVQNWTVPEDVSYSASQTFKTDIFDTPLQNLAGDATLRKDAAAVSAAGNGIAMQDATKEDGWAAQTSSWMTNFIPVEENKVLMSYANTVLRAVLEYLEISQQQFPEGCTSDGIPQTTNALYQLAELIVARAQEKGATSPAFYRQLLFMAARRCNVWCPADISGAEIEEAKLHPSYARGNWRLPSSALLARIFNFLGNSRSGYNTNAAPAIAYAEQSEGGQAANVSLEAQKPLFANAIARGRSIPISSGSYHWSSTEISRYGARFVSFSSGYAYTNGKYYGYVVRAVTAFTFTA